MATLGSGPEPHRGPAPSEVPIARSEDIAHRRRVYTIQMSVRMACFLALPFVPGWWKVVALVGALALPYLAVLMANDPDLRSHREAAVPHGQILPAGSEPGRPAPPVIRVDEDGRVEDADDSPASTAAPRDGEPS